MSECKLKIICKACVPGDKQWSYAHLFKPCFKYAERPYGEFVILRQCRNKAVAAGQGSIALSGVSLTSKRQNHHTYGHHICTFLWCRRSVILHTDSCRHQAVRSMYQTVPGALCRHRRVKAFPNYAKCGIIKHKRVIMGCLKCFS